MATYTRRIANNLAAGLYADLTATATVERLNWVEIDADSLRTARVIVLPGGVEISKVDRNNSQVDASIMVYVGQRVATDQQVDAIADVADEVLQLMRQHDWSNLASWPEAASSPSELSVQFNPDDGLNDRNIWRAIINATYRLFVSDVAL